MFDLANHESNYDNFYVQSTMKVLEFMDTNSRGIGKKPTLWIL